MWIGNSGCTPGPHMQPNTSITFLASANSQFLETIHFIFILPVMALLVAILPRLDVVKVKH